MTEEVNAEKSVEVIAPITLDEVFGDDKPEAKTPEVKVDETKVDKSEDESDAEVEAEAKDDPKDEPKEDPKKEVEVKTDKPETVPLGLLLEERSKRQEVEAKLKETQTEEPKKDFFEDPENAVKDAVAEVDKKWERKFLGQSLRMAASRYDDFADAAQAFENAVADNPGLYAQAMNAEDFGEVVYKVGRDFLQLAEVGDLSAFREKIAKEEREKLLAEQKEQADKRDKKLSEVPESLSTVQTEAQRDIPSPGPIPLDDVFEGR